MTNLKIEGQVERVDGRELSYGEFVDRYMAKNLPVVLTGLMDCWRACRDWVTPDGKPNLSFFTLNFGASRVQVADCGSREFTDQRRVEMSVSEFVEEWRRRQECGDIANLAGEFRHVLYLKDWHFVREYPDYEAYRTPLFFKDDWLNLYLDHYRMHEDSEARSETDDVSCSDYRFVYMGAKGSWTPLHADVFRSYSWSANVCGKKRWLFLSPSQHHLVFDRHMKHSIYDIYDEVSSTIFPNFEKSVWFECIQESGDIIFVPSGWYHQVHNMDDTISINHNWFNGHNLTWIWDLLSRDYDEAKEYIEDIRDICDDFEGLCQRNLAANTGMNFSDFFTLMARMAFANVSHLFSVLMSNKEEINDLSSVVKHLSFNLSSIRKISMNMKLGEGSVRLENELKLADISSDSNFLGLSISLNETYRTLFGMTPLLADASKALEDLKWSQVRSPEGLVSLLDLALAKINIDSRRTNILLTEDNFAKTGPS
ncbi:hypothetical protein MLD38_032000 [Melastoma candidum]|uniref:Uncharacterized protein n=1 Tax=Melastoma candidum TaxID=119954 RepID=A0ACB9MUM7_9MYRT|nr:hypothetical protein MLD38_032000 [Melastoma candidum]